MINRDSLHRATTRPNHLVDYGILFMLIRCIFLDLYKSVKKNEMKVVLLISMLFAALGCNAQSNNREYSTFIQEVLIKRSEFKESFNKVDSTRKDSILIRARNYLLAIMSEDVFPYWYGTKWDFNGMTRTPKQGTIACGYFVTNTLSDIGFNIPRIKWAQSASELFIRKLALNVKRFSNKPLSEVESYLLETGDGLYLVGLDMHVGFLVVKDKTIKFVHSSYYRPEIGVMSEEITSRNPFSDSGYRVIGTLLSDEMVVKWMNNTLYE